jgi:hypothetical protein
MVAMLLACFTGAARADEPDTVAAERPRQPRPSAMVPT